MYTDVDVTMEAHVQTVPVAAHDGDGVPGHCLLLAHRHVTQMAKVLGLCNDRGIDS